MASTFTLPARAVDVPSASPGAVRLPFWRKQFVGRGPTSALRVGEDIANISGATLSCTHVTDGVRRIVAVVALARRGGVLT